MKTIYLDEENWNFLEALHKHWEKEWEEKIVPSYLASIEHCFYCGREVYDLGTHEQFTGIRPPRDQEQTVDHVIPLSKSGLDTPENKVIACRRCNTLKGVKIWTK